MLLRQSELRRVLGKRLLKKLIASNWIRPVQSEQPRQVFFDSEQVHRALGTRLPRKGYTLLLPALPPEPESTGAKVSHLEDFVLDQEQLARLLE
jgi:hypothetical protein